MACLQCSMVSLVGLPSGPQCTCALPDTRRVLCVAGPFGASIHGGVSPLHSVAAAACSRDYTIAAHTTDSTMYRQTNIMPAVQALRPFSLYGDSAYRLQPGLLKPYPGSSWSVGGRCIWGPTAHWCLCLCLCMPMTGHNLPPNQRQFNQRMSSVRISVEWNFGRLKVAPRRAGTCYSRTQARAHDSSDISQSLFPSTVWKQHNRVRLSAVGDWTMFAALLANAHNCVSPNQTAQFFGVCPPTLSQYFT